MIVGLDGSKWTELEDPKATVNTEPPVEILIWRAYDGWRDDPKFVEHRRQSVGLTNRNGQVLWGCYMYLGYTSTSEGGRHYQAARGDEQFSNFWSLITAGGIEWQVPVTIDVEKNSYQDDNDVKQYMPWPPVKTYADTFLVPAIQAAFERTGRLPILYSNPDTILHFLAPLKGIAAYQIIFDCPLWVADYNPIRPDGSYAYYSSIKKYFPVWLIHQTRGSISGWPGVAEGYNIDVNRCQGTRAQWKAWCRDATQPLPQDGATDPVEPPPVVVPPPVTNPDLTKALELINAKLDAITLQVQDIDKDVTVIRSHFRP